MGFMCQPIRTKISVTKVSRMHTASAELDYCQRRSILIQFNSKSCRQFRMLRLWKEEVGTNGLKMASLNRVVLRFCSRQILIAVIVNIINVIFTFAGPVSWYFSLIPSNYKI